MEDGAESPCVLGSCSSVGFDFMDELLFEGCWLEADERLNPTPFSSCNLLNSSTSSDDLVTLGTIPDPVNPSPPQISQLEVQRSNSSDNPLSLHHPPSIKERSIGTQSQEQKALQISTSGEGFTDPSQRWWIGPTTDPGSTSVKERLMTAISYIKGSARDKDALIQIWVPVKKGGKNVLTTNDQPFSIDPNSQSLANYRNVSRKYRFPAYADSTESVGLPGRVFLGKTPEWTPDVRFFRSDEYPRVGHAWRYQVRGSLALPIFGHGSGTCLGVLEVVTTSQKMNYRPELENICRALEAVDLRSSQISIPPAVKARQESYKAALPEIAQILKHLCKTHSLPLAQTWAPCIQQGKSGCWHSEKNNHPCLSIVDSAFCATDQRGLGFHEACSEHHLLRHQGIVVRASTTNRLCFETDISAYGKTEYPLSHHARMVGLRAAVAIRLRSIYTASDDFILEFFLPPDCQDIEEQHQKLNSLSVFLHQASWGLRAITDHELEEESMPTGELVVSSGGRFNGNEIVEIVPPAPSKGPSTEEASWIIQMVQSQHRESGESIVLPQTEFKIMTSWDKTAVELPQEQAYNLEPKSSSEGSPRSSFNEHSSLGAEKSGKKRQTKTNKTIGLQVLQQYFAGGLKDAAKSIGVCPTTLKRICRQHGINRWPSRKIKKVDHSLRKLQLVIDSVEGVHEGVKIDSFYKSFPELSSTSLNRGNRCSSMKAADQLKLLDSEPQPQCEGGLFSPEATTRSPSSSCSHSSGSSYCCVTVAKQHSSLANTPSRGDTVAADDICTALKRSSSDAELREEELQPLPKSSEQGLRDRTIFKVKATFGEGKIHFSLQENWTFRDLQQEIASRFCIDDTGKIDLKYLDDDFEWVLLTCDADLEECIDLHKSVRSRTIKLSLHEASHLYPRSLGSTCPS